MAKKILIYILLLLTIQAFSSDIDSLKKIIRQTNNDSVKAVTLLRISNYFMDYDTDSLFIYAEKVLQIAKNNNYKNLMAEAYNLMGVANDINNNFSQSLKYYDKALRVAQDSFTIITIKLNKGIVFLANGLYDQAYLYLNEVLNYAKKHNDKTLQSPVFAYFSQIFAKQKKFDSAFYYIQKTLKIDKELKDTFNIADCYIIISDIFYEQNKLDSALFYLKKAEQISRHHNFGYTESIFSRLGDIYFKRQNFKKALKYYKLALNAEKKLNLLTPVTINYLNLAKTHLKLNNFKKAIFYKDSAYTNNSLDNNSDITNKQIFYKKIYEFYDIMNQSDSALKYYKKYIATKDSVAELQHLYKTQILSYQNNLLKIKNQLEHTEKENKRKTILIRALIALIIIAFISFVFIISLLLRLKKTEKKLNNKNNILKKLHQKDQIQVTLFNIQKNTANNFDKLSFEEIIKNTFKELSEIDWLKHIKKYAFYLPEADTFKILTTLNADEIEKNCKTPALNKQHLQTLTEGNYLILEADKLCHINLNLSQFKVILQPVKQGKNNYGLTAFLFDKKHLLNENDFKFFYQFSYIIASIVRLKLQSIKIREEIEKQAILNQKIFAKTLLVEQQKHELERLTNKLKTTLNNLDASINYAAYMVESMLQPEAFLSKLFDDYFLIFKPLGKIGGDFYFAAKIENKIYFAVGDATGHGIPGTILAMQGVFILQEIIFDRRETQPSQILERLRTKIKRIFKKTDKQGITYNSIDLGLGRIDIKTNELTFAGANLPLYIVRNKKIIKLKSVKSPLGQYLIERPYKEESITLQNNDTIYLQSDGYIDQIGEISFNHFSKFGTKRYTDLLAEISDKPCDEQKKILLEKFYNWKKSNSQIDDITILGIKWKIKKQ